MKNKTKLLSLVFIIAFMLILAISINAEDRIPVETWDISATADDNVIANLYEDPANAGMYTLEITGTGNMKDYEYNSQVPYSSFYIEITSAIVGNEVNNIGNYAFSSCDNLKKIEIGENVKTIGEHAFSWSTRLKEVVIPNSVTSIGKSAFNYCSTLENVEMSNRLTSISDYMFYFCSNLENIVIPNSVTTIGEYSFCCSDLKSITIPDNVITVGDYAFSDCYALASVKIGDGATSIGDYAFVDCYELEGVKIGNNVTSIGKCAFYNCGCLASMVIPDSVKSIGGAAFQHCINLKSVIIGKNVDFIGSAAFNNCVGLKLVTIDSANVAAQLASYDSCGYLVDYADIVLIDSSITEVGIYIAQSYPYTFKTIYNNTTYTVYTKTSQLVESWDISATINDNVTANLYNDPLNEGKHVFNIMGEGKMTDWYSSAYVPWRNSEYRQTVNCVYITEGIKNIGNGAFYGFMQLTYVNIPNSIRAIGRNAFEYCDKLTSDIIIPDGVEIIEERAFSSCHSIKYIEISETVKEIKNDAFASCISAEIIIPTYSKLEVIGENAFSRCLNINNITIPSSVIRIGARAFASCENLERIIIPENVEKIDSYVFEFCYNLKSVYISKSVSFISPNAFTGCSGLTEIKIDQNNSNYQDIDGVVYTKNMIRLVRFPQAKQTDNYAILNGCMSISENAFKECIHLANIELPNSVTYIDYDAFYGCTSLISINIPDAVTTVRANAFWECSNLKFVIINSPTIASNLILNTNTTCGGLIYYADTILINSTITEIGSYLTNTSNFAYTDTVSVYGADYKVFSKHSHASDSTVWSEVDENSIITCLECGLQKEVETRTPVETWDISATADDNVIANLYEDPDNEGMYTLEITGTGNMKDWTYYDRTPWYAKSYYSKIMSLYIENNITSIGAYAFFNFDELETIEIVNSIKLIGTGAFGNCDALKELYFNAVSMDDLNSDHRIFAWSGGKIKIIIGNEVERIPKNLFNSYGNNQFNATEIVFEDGSRCEEIGVNAFYCCNKITSIKLPNSVKTIGIGAFYDCELLESVELSNQLIEIGRVAFEFCDNLKYIELPNSLSEIGEKAFYGCNLSYIAIPDGVKTIGNSTFAGCPLEKVDLSNNLKTIGENAFLYCKFTEIVLPNAVTTIGNYAFSNCENLTKIEIPNNVTRIGSSAFSNCTSIQTVKIGSGVQAIGSSAFSGCTAIEKIYFEAISITGVSSNTFMQAGQNSAGIYVFISKDVEIIPSNLFCNSYYSDTYAAKIVEVEFENGSKCTSIGAQAFYGCVYLKEIQIPENVTELGKDIFDKCTSLEKIFYNAKKITSNTTSIGIFSDAGNNGNGIILTIGKNVAEIPKSMFSSMVKLETMQFEDGSMCEIIGSSAFSNCTNLKNIEIPENIKTIGTSAFGNCVMVENIYFNAIEMNDMTYHTYVFANVGRDGLGVNVTIGKNTTRIPAYFSYTGHGGDEMKIVSVEFENGSVCKTIGYSAFYSCIYLTDVVLPNSITEIGDNAFRSCESLKNLTIGSEVMSIGNYAFCGCESLKCIDIPEKLKTLGTCAFEGCISLERVKFNAICMDDLNYSSYTFRSAGQNTSGLKLTIGKNVTRIPAYLFSSNSNYLELAHQLISIDFESGSACETIGEYAFYYCTQLSRIEIPSSIKSIESSAFGACYKLVEVYNLSSLDIAKNSNNGSVAYNALNIYTSNDGERKTFETEDGFVFYRDGETCYLLGYVGTETEIFLPENCNGKDYGIYQYAFINSQLLTSINLPDCVTSIGSCAFYNCTSLTSINLPDCVTSIGSRAFYNCTSLEKIEFNAIAMNDCGNGYNVFGYGQQNGKEIELFIGKEVTRIPAWLFYNAKISSVEFEENSQCELIGEYAFRECRSLTSITIPDSVKTIGTWAFYSCSKLSCINLSVNTTMFGEGAFYGCSSLANVEIPNGTTIISRRMFYGCTSLLTIKIPNSVTAIYDEAFYNCKALINVEIPQSVNVVYKTAFSNCNNAIDKINGVHYVDKWVVGCDKTVNSVEINDGTVGIAIGAFADCSSLLSVEMPNSVKNVGESAFNNCTSLVGVILSDSITELKNSIFSGCISLTDLKIPDGVKLIENYAFSSCKALMNIKIPNNVTSIGNSAFSNCSSLTYVEMPNSLTSISSYAFRKCTSLKSVEIPNSVVEIGDLAFEDCSALISVKIPDSVTKIAYAAFRNCYSLTKVEIGTGIKDIKQYAFEKCYSLEEIYFNAISMNNLERDYNGVFFEAGKTGNGIKVIIGKDVVKVPAYLFGSYSPKITSLEFEKGSNCETLGYGSFYNCIYLEEVYFNVVSLKDLNSSNKVFSCAGQSGNGIKVVIGKDVKSIPAYLFCSDFNLADAPNVTSVEFEEGSICETIGAGAFYNCSKLDFVKIDSSAIAKSIEYGSDVGHLTYYADTVLINSNITELGAYLTNTSNFAYTDTVSVCGTDYKVFSKHAHSDDMFELSVNNPTCSEYGYNVYTCTTCGMAKTETIEKLPHREEIIPAVPSYKDANKNVIAGMSSGVKCSVCETVIKQPVVVDKFYVQGNRLSLSDYVNVDYGLVVPDNYTNVYVVYVSDANIDSDSVVVEYDGSGISTYRGIRMQNLGDNIHATMYATTPEGLTAVFVQAEYSVRTYCVNQLAKDTNGAEFKTMISDLIEAGAIAQQIKKYKLDQLVNKGADIEGLLTPSTNTTISGEKIDTSVVYNSELNQKANITNKNLSVGNAMAVQFLLTIKSDVLANVRLEVVVDRSVQKLSNLTYTYSMAEENIEVYNASKSQYIVKVPDLRVIEYDAPIIATIYVGDEAVQQQTYSVNTYFENNYAKTSVDATMRKFLLAMYNYGMSAAAYKNA